MIPAMFDNINPIKTPKLPCVPLASIPSPAAANNTFWDSCEEAAYFLLSSNIGRAVFVETNIIVPTRKTNKARPAKGIFTFRWTA